MICPVCGETIPDNSTECFICGESTTRQMSYNYSSAVNNMATMRYEDQLKKDKDKKKLVTLISVATFILVVFVALIKLGIFENKDGVYSVQDTQELWNKIMQAEGIEGDFSGVDVKMEMTINGRECTMHTGITYMGMDLADENWHGKVSFFGSKVTINWDDDTNLGWGVAKYDSKNKAITFELDSEDAEFYGVSDMQFVKNQ